MLKVFMRLIQNLHSIQLNNLFRLTNCNFCHVAVMDSWILCSHLLWNHFRSCECAFRMFLIPQTICFKEWRLKYKFNLDRSLYKTSLIHVSALQWPITASSAEVKSEMRLLNFYLSLRRTYGGKTNGWSVGFAFLVYSV